jgi:type I pantothenate kinase
VDAVEADLEQWYVERFLALRDTVFQNPSSYFHRYAHLSRDDAVGTARELWNSINLVKPAAEHPAGPRGARAPDPREGRDHAVRRVKLRKL